MRVHHIARDRTFGFGVSEMIITSIDNITGAIVGTCDINPVHRHRYDSPTYVDGAPKYGVNSYYDSGEFKEKISIYPNIEKNVKVGSSITIDSLPIFTKIHVDGECVFESTEDDDEACIVFNSIGEYSIQISGPRVVGFGAAVNVNH